MKIIGLANAYNSDDKRCNDHIDFSHGGWSIYEGTDFLCTYCGDEWKDGLSENERRARKMAEKGLRHCDSCMDYAPMFKGDKCAECVAEAAAPVTVDVDGEKWTQVIRNNTVIRYITWEYVTGIISYRDNAWTTVILDTDSLEVIRVEMSDSQPNTTFTLSGLTWVLMENMGYESDDISSEIDDYDYPEYDEYDSDLYESPDSDLMNEW